MPQTPDTVTAAQTGNPVHDDPELQGEGNYTAARRHRESVEKFIEEDRVDEAAAEAAPHDAAEEREMQEAEQAGLAHAKR